MGYNCLTFKGSFNPFGRTFSDCGKNESTKAFRKQFDSIQRQIQVPECQKLKGWVRPVWL